MKTFKPKYFSSKEKEEEKRKGDKKTGMSLTNQGVLLGTIGLTQLHNLNSINKEVGSELSSITRRIRNSEEAKDIYNKLKDEVKKKDIIFDDNAPQYNGTAMPKRENLRKGFAKIAKSIKDKKERKEFIEELNRASKDYGKKYKIGKAGIYIGQSLKNNPEILAHEMGHNHYYGEGKKSLGGLLHKGQRLNQFAKIHSGLVGFHSGIKAAQAEAKGKKESLWNKTKSAIIPGIHIASSIGSEIAASAYGYKKLKEMGASEELLKDSRKSLRSALESHLADDLKILATGAIGRGAGILAGKAYYASKKKKADNKKKDEEENN